MNPFASIPASDLRAVHRRLARSLKSTQYTQPMDDDYHPVNNAVRYTVVRLNQPTGRSAAMIAAMLINGPMTSAELAIVGQCRSKHTWSLLKRAMGRGLVRSIGGRGQPGVVQWEAL